MASSLQHTASLSAADVSILDEFHLRVTTIGIVLDCEVCGNALTLTLCQTDRRGNAGKPMARHPQCEFFKWFPRLLVYPQIIALITSLSPSVAQRAAPGPSINGDKKPRRHGNRCAGPLCRRSAALRCAREMCLSHCKDVGGCPFHGIIDPNSEEIVLDEDESLDFAPSPAAAPAFDYEYEDLPLPSQSQSTQPLLSQGTRQSLPSSSQSRSSQPLPPQETRHSATSSLQTDDGGKIRPRITRQLDPLWMSDLNQRARREVEDQKAAERRKEMEQAAKRRFILYWFDQDDVPASRRWITNCPYFPQYQLISDLDVLSVLGEDVSQIEVFEPSLHQWIAAGLDYTFTVQSGGHVFIRRFGVTRCALFDDLLNASKDSGRPTHIRHNLRGERDGTRAKLLKLKALSPIKDQSDSDIEIVEVTMRENRKRVRSSSVVSTAAHSRSSLSRASSLAMIDELSGSSQPRSPSPSSSTSPSTIHSFATQTSSSSLSTQPPPPSQCYPGPLHLPVVTPVLVPTYEGRQVWPHGMYTQDMVCGFRQLADKKLQACYPPHMLFKMVFGVSFIKGTYYDNLKAWTKTNHHVLAQCEAAGRTPQGLWCYYLAARREALGMKSKVKARKLM